MPPLSAGCYLRSYRKKSGLSQRELAEIIGVATEWQVSLHEQSREIPFLITAISYEMVFRVPLSRLFPGIYETLQQNIECRLAELEERLHQSTAKGRAATSIAQARVDVGTGKCVFIAF